MLTKPEVMVNAFEKGDGGAFVNCNLRNGDLINEGIKDRIGNLFQTVVDETRKIRTASANPSTKKLQVLAFAGSLRNASVNAGLLRAAAGVVPDNADLEM